MEKENKAIIILLFILMGLLAFCILLISASLHPLLGESEYRFRSAFHGVFAGIFMVTMTIGLYQAFKLWVGVPLNIRELGLGAVINSVACFFTGNGGSHDASLAAGIYVLGRPFLKKRVYP